MKLLCMPVALPNLVLRTVLVEIKTVMASSLSGKVFLFLIKKSLKYESYIKLNFEVSVSYLLSA